jgi:alkylated DNA nucleotide flippase Atl1
VFAGKPGVRRLRQDGRVSQHREDPRRRQAEAEPGAESDLPDFAERVLDLIERVPPGRVMTYGDIAEYLEEGGPRQVGRVLALYGGSVPWWRVVRADGKLLPGHELRALDHYREEGTALREAALAGSGHLPKVDLRRARWDGEPASAGGADSE